MAIQQNRQKNGTLREAVVDENNVVKSIITDA